MLQLTLFILINAGMSYGLTKADLLKEFRIWLERKHLYANSIEMTNRTIWFLKHVFDCPLCMGYWSAIPAYLIVYNAVDTMLIGYMFIGSITAMLMYVIINRLK